VGSCASRTGEHRRENLGASLFISAHMRARRLEDRRGELSNFAQFFHAVGGDNQPSKGSSHETMPGMPQRAAASIQENRNFSCCRSVAMFARSGFFRGLLPAGPINPGPLNDVYGAGAHASPEVHNVQGSLVGVV
jgi:hypothetical protein